MDEKKKQTSGIFFVAFMATALTAFVAWGFWTIGNMYFSKISPWLWFPIMIAVTGVVFGFISKVLFHWRFNKPMASSSSVGSTNENLLLTKKILALEERVAALKSENRLLKDQGGVPNAQIDIIVRERAFLHELANKVQIIHAGCGLAIDSLNEPQCDIKKVVKELEMAFSNAEKVANLIKENRDYLILAS
jgi:hypothetical protein